MAKSMTGYGRSEFAVGGDSYAVEVKCLNHRFLDITLRAPDRFSAIENRIRDAVKGRFSRGSFTLYFSHVSGGNPALKINLALARTYIDAADELKRKLGVTGGLDLEALLKLKDIFTVDRLGPLGDAEWAACNEALQKAFDNVEAWRIKEGGSLKDDVLTRLAVLEKVLAERIVARVPAMLDEYRARLKTNIERLIKDRVDESRIILEAAVFAERSDVSEEVTRLKSHLEIFRKFFSFEEPVGKRFDFLCQEIGREINTIGSKSNDVGITESVIEMKGELEKIREQVQNIE